MQKMMQTSNNTNSQIKTNYFLTLKKKFFRENSFKIHYNYFSNCTKGSKICLTIGGYKLANRKTIVKFFYSNNLSKPETSFSQLGRTFIQIISCPNLIGNGPPNKKHFYFG